MDRILIDGIIYKTIKYSDNSAIALCYTKEYGKIKFFIPKAYSKKSGVISLIPGEVDFLKKDNSDLNKLYTFRPNPNFMFFIEEPIISLRLTLIFDVFDNLYDLMQEENRLWDMILRIKKDNIYSATIYIIYYMLKNSGYMFTFDECFNCQGIIDKKSVLINGVTYCDNCKSSGGINISPDDYLILRALNKPELYRNLSIKLSQELSILEIFTKHIEVATSKGLKSFNTFKSLVKSL